MRRSAFYGHSDLPQAVHDGDDNLPEVVPQSHLEPVKPAWEQEKYLHSDSAEYATKPYEHSTSIVHGEHQSRPGERRILGLRPKTFFTVSVIAAFVIFGIIVGIAVPLSMANRQTSGSPSPPATSSPDARPGVNTPNTTSNLVSGSSLAATNYTDSAGFMHLYVFFQASNKELVTSTWDSQNKTWTTLSISQIFASSGIVLDLLPASPIAAYTYTNPTFQTRVYFLTTGNSIRELVTSEDPSLKSRWRQGRLGGDRLITTAPGSKLAALRPQCGTSKDCQVNFPWMAVAYQGEGGVVAVSRADLWEPMEIKIGPARSGVGVGLSSVMRNGNITDVEWSLIYEEAGNLQEFKSEALVTEWTRGPSMGPAAPSMTANFASFSYDLVNMMVITVAQDGSLGLRTWNTQSWGISQAPNLLSTAQAPKNPKFSAVAGNSQRRVYGVVDGRIHEWEFFSLSPVQWTYIGEVAAGLE